METNRQRIIEDARRYQVDPEPLIGLAEQLGVRTVLRALAALETPPQGLRDPLAYVIWRARRLVATDEQAKAAAAKHQAALTREELARSQEKIDAAKKRDEELEAFKKLSPESVERLRAAALADAAPQLAAMFRQKRPEDSRILRGMILTRLKLERQGAGEV